MLQVLRMTKEIFCRYAKYVRERGEVEREYARALRKLVARCRPGFDDNDVDLLVDYGGDIDDDSYYDYDDA